MRITLINKIISLFLISILFSLYSYAAGGGGGGGSSSGLGFGARDSIFLLISKEYSEKFSLKNSTKYKLKMEVIFEKVTVDFGTYSLDLEEGDNLLDLNDNNFADINFKLESVLRSRANIRIINMKDTVKIKEEPVVVEKIKADEQIEEQEDSSEDEIKCGNLSTLKERVSCRLDLDKEEQIEELEVYFMPEECRILTKKEQDYCIDRYHSVQKCWNFPVGNERVSCVKVVMNLGNTKNEKQSCSNLDENEKSICLTDLQNKVYNLIKWQFYDLEERAEDFMIRGLAKREDAIDFISKTELSKVDFNQAKTKEERKNIILDVRANWKEFVNVVRENLRG